MGLYFPTAKFDSQLFFKRDELLLLDTYQINLIEREALQLKGQHLANLSKEG